MGATLTKPPQSGTVGCVFDLLMTSGETGLVVKVELPTKCDITRTGTGVRSAPIPIEPPRGWDPRPIPVPGKGRAGKTAPPDWAIKKRISLCDFFDAKCLALQRPPVTITIKIYSPAGDLLVTRTVTFAPGATTGGTCACPGNQ